MTQTLTEHPPRATALSRLALRRGALVLVAVLVATLGVLATLTPEVLYSGAVPSPNGVEMGLGFVLWASLLAVVRQDDARRRQGTLLALAFAAAVPLTFLRMLGPLWIVLIVG